MMYEEIREQTKKVVEQLLAEAKLEPGDLVVVGCSSSEVLGKKIGSASSPEAAKAIFHVIWEELQERELRLAAQCCEHLNRALVVERQTAREYGLERVNAIPQPKAGGSFGTAAYNGFAEPVLVESLRNQARAGIDIGDTLIGMHLAPVAVPVRTEVREIGEAHVVCARSRVKFVGGVRAVYEEKLL